MTLARIRDALRTGSPLDMKLLRLDSTLVREALLPTSDNIDPRGLTISNASMVGELDMRAVRFAHPIRFENCTFETALSFEGASLHELSLTNCPKVPGLLANGLALARDLTLSGSRFAGSKKTSGSTSKAAAIWLCEADIGGKILCVGTVVDPGAGRAIHADRLHLGGTIRLLDGFIARGEIRMIGARIDVSIDLTNVSITSRRRALDLAETEIGGSMFIVNLKGTPPSHIRGLIDMGNAHIKGELLLRNTTLEENTSTREPEEYVSDKRRGTTINAPRLTVEGDVSFEGNCVVTGGIDLSRASLGHLVFHTGCALSAGHRTALDLTRADLHADLVLAPGVRVAGSIRITSSRIGGNLTLQGAVLNSPEGRSLLAAQAAQISGDVELQGLAALGGQLRFRNARLGSVFDAGGAELSNAAGSTISLHQAVIEGSVNLNAGFTSVGRISLNRCHIKGRFECSTGSFTGAPQPESRTKTNAIDAIAANIQGGIYLGWREISPGIDLTGCTTSTLVDDPAHWPSRYFISGLTYERFGHLPGSPPESVWNSHARLAWLDGQTNFDRGPYEQPARVFRQHGFQAEAESFLIAQRSRARPHSQHIDRLGQPKHVLRNLREALYGLSAGYGFRPARALWAIVALLIAVVIGVHAGQAEFRATDPRGNVYSPSGRLVTVTDVPAAPTGDTAPILDNHRGDFASVSPNAASTDACGDGQVRCFDVFFYAADTVVLLVSFNQRNTWYPDTRSTAGFILGLLLNIATILGWLLSTVFALSFARFARNL